MFIVIRENIHYKRFKTEEIVCPFIYKNIEIVVNNNDYYFLLKRNNTFSDGEKYKKIEPKHYELINKKDLNVSEIFVYENDNGYDDYKLYKNEDFLYANHPKASLISMDPLLGKYYLYCKGGYLKTNYEYLLLNDRVYKNELLNEGDIICFHNLRIIYHQDFLYMNNFLVDNKLIRKQLSENVIKYENRKANVKNYFFIENNELELEEIREYKALPSSNQRSLIYQIGPSITMSVSMIAIASINVYINLSNNEPLLKSLVYILMPFTMLLSGVMWPILSNSSEKRKIKKENKKRKNAYLDYLNKYEQDLINKLNDYKKEVTKDFFSGEIDDEKLFYITNKHTSFLNISIGFITSSEDLKLPLYEDKDILELGMRIKYRVSNIENFPYYLSVLKYKTVSIVANRNKKINLIKKYSLELASKYHFDDFYLAIYSEDINEFCDLYSIPQLIYKNTRLTLNKKSELVELNNYLFDKPLVLLANNRTDFIFNNEQIHLIQFCNNDNDICKNSEILIKYLSGKKGFIFSEKKIEFSYNDETIDYKKLSEYLAPYQKVSLLKEIITFKDIYKDLNIPYYYANKQISLKAEFATSNDDILFFDLHESKSGPHGLIGGSTGSGKSELIVSMLLSLCIRYRPDYLNIILIDYKGGGIKESLSYKGLVVPHIIASIDNLQTNIFDRLIVAIDFECRKRQMLFKELSNKAMISIMNIDDYLQNDYASYGLPPMAHLLIVVDEFAELKKNNGEIIKELISFSRIGRSLGVHLILATQRPNGAIDDEIWSNSHFKIALKLFSEKDSNDIIKRKDAAYLSNPGEFYLCVDESTIKANSIYAKSDINSNEKQEVMLLDNRLNVIDRKSKKEGYMQSQANYIVSQIIEASKKLGIKSAELNFKVPISHSRNELRKIYKNSGGLIIGEIDDYKNNYQDILTIDEKMNALIYSTRNKEIEGIINSLSKRTIVIGHKKYESSYISDSLLYDDIDDIKYLFNKLFSCDNELTLLIEDLICFLSYDERFNEYLCQLLRRNSKTNINVLALTSQSNISFRLLNCFKNKYVIEANDNQDLINIFCLHSKYKGKSFFFNEEIIPFVPCTVEELVPCERILENYIETIPKIITYKRKNDSVLLGYNKQKRLPVYLNEKDKLLICSNDKDVIQKYQRIYANDQNISVECYMKKTNKEEFEKILWLGKGLYSQRLFYVDGNIELLENEGFYLDGNKAEILRIVDE